MKNQLQDMVNRVNEAQGMLLKLEERYDAQEIEFSRMELLNSKLDEQLKKTKAALKEANKLLEDQSVKDRSICVKRGTSLRECSTIFLFFLSYKKRKSCRLLLCCVLRHIQKSKNFPIK